MKIRNLISCALCGLTLFACSPSGGGKDREMDCFITDLMDRMTLREKLGQLNLPSGGDLVTGSVMNGELSDMIRKQEIGGFFNVKGIQKINALQHLAVEESRLKIPLLVGADVIHGYETIFPIPLALSCSWDTLAVERMARISAIEASADGINWTFSPMVDICRDARWGRIAEGNGEDPYLGSLMAKAYVRGYQGNNMQGNDEILACVKHFAVNNQETERNWVNVEIDERTLREIYLPAFEAAVKKAKVRSIMGAYNLFRGVHCCENNELLGEILRKEWNYDGLIVSDWGGIHDTKAAAESPIDVEMSIYANFDEYCMADPLLNAVRNGEIEEERIDEKVKSILRFMLRVKMIDIVEVESGDNEQTAISAGCMEQKPAVYAVRDWSRKKGSYDTSAHQDAVLETARESIVLLKNEEQRLPLAPEKTHRLLVIGHNAAKLHSNGG